MKGGVADGRRLLVFFLILCFNWGPGMIKVVDADPLRSPVVLLEGPVRLRELDGMFLHDLNALTYLVGHQALLYLDAVLLELVD